MASPSPQSLWYVARDGQKYGPMLIHEIQERFRSGQVAPTDHMWSAEVGKWILAGEVFGAAPPPPPPPAAIQQASSGRLATEGQVPVNDWSIATEVVLPKRHNRASNEDELSATRPINKDGKSLDGIKESNLARVAAIAGIVGAIIAAIALVMQFGLLGAPSNSDLANIIKPYVQQNAGINLAMSNGHFSQGLTRDEAEQIAKISVSILDSSCRKSEGQDGFNCTATFESPLYGKGRFSARVMQEGTEWKCADWFPEIEKIR